MTKVFFIVLVFGVIFAVTKSHEPSSDLERCEDEILPRLPSRAFIVTHTGPWVPGNRTDWLVDHDGNRYGITCVIINNKVTLRAFHSN